MDNTLTLAAMGTISDEDAEAVAHFLNKFGAVGTLIALRASLDQYWNSTGGVECPPADSKQYIDLMAAVHMMDDMFEKYGVQWESTPSDQKFDS